MRMMGFLPALMLAAAPAAAQAPAPTPTLSITAGETVTVRIEGNPAGFVELSRERGEAGGPHAENIVRFTFSGGAMPMLKVENGYAQGFDYRARMFAGTRSARTSVCTVMPRIMGFEGWQQPIDRLELSAPRLSDTPAMACR
jgi:hypothetical protein